MVREPLADVGELAALYAAKAAAEEGVADALVPRARVRSAGDPYARVLLVKGDPGETDLAAGEALAGADGSAAHSALEALGVDTASVLAVVSRPAPDVDAATAVRRLALYLEACDPAIAVALDGVAASDLAEASRSGPLAFGRPAEVRGRTLVAVDGLEASLDDDARKRRVWEQFRGLKTQQGRR